MSLWAGNLTTVIDHAAEDDGLDPLASAVGGGADVGHRVQAIGESQRRMCGGRAANAVWTTPLVLVIRCCIVWSLLTRQQS